MYGVYWYCQNTNSSDNWHGFQMRTWKIGNVNFMMCMKHLPILHFSILIWSHIGDCGVLRSSEGAYYRAKVCEWNRYLLYFFVKYLLPVCYLFTGVWLSSASSTTKSSNTRSCFTLKTTFSTFFRTYKEYSLINISTESQQKLTQIQKVLNARGWN